MKKLEVGKISSGSKAPISDRSLEHLQEADRETARAILKTLIDDGLFNTNDYSGILKLHGAFVVDNNDGTFTQKSGAIYYQGEIYLVEPLQTAITNAPAWKIVTSYRNGDPVEFSDGVAKDFHAIEKMAIVDSSDGSAIENDANTERLIDVNAEQLEGTIFGGNISHDGINTGIGTATPGRLLDVAGDMEINGSIFSGANSLNLINSGGTIELKTNVSTQIFFDQNNDGIGSLQFYSGGSEIARFSNSGFLGINNTTPQQRIDVVGNIKASSNFLVGSQVNFSDGATDVYINKATTDGLRLRAKNQIEFFTANGGASATEKMRLSAEGNLGIGVLSPFYKLEVDGDIRILGDNYRIRNGRFLSSNETETFVGDYDNYNGTNPLNFYQGGNLGFSLRNGGNIGVGTLSPNEKLHVLGNLEINDRLRISLSSAPTSAGLEIALTNGDSYASLSTQYSGTFSDVINIERSTQRIGINKINPSEALDVDGSIVSERKFVASDSNPLVRFQSADRTSEKGYVGYLSGDGMRLWNETASDGIVVLDNGLVGIGTTSPSEKLEVAGNVELSGLIKSGTNSLELSNAGDIVLNGGNVGIGTTSPSSKLEVNGKSDFSAGGIKTKTEVFSGSGTISQYTNFVEYTGSNQNILTASADEDGMFVWVAVTGSGQIGFDDSAGNQIDTVTAGNTTLFVNVNGTWKVFLEGSNT